MKIRYIFRWEIYTYIPISLEDQSTAGGPTGHPVRIETTPIPFPVVRRPNVWDTGPIVNGIGSRIGPCICCSPIPSSPASEVEVI